MIVCCVRSSGRVELTKMTESEAAEIADRVPAMHLFFLAKADDDEV